MDGLKLSLLGPFGAWLNGRPIARFRSNRVQALLVYLAIETAAGQSSFAREMLMDLLWPGLPQKSAQTNLRTTLYQLRQAVPELVLDGDGEPVSLLLTDRKSVRLNPNYPLELDVSLFHHGLRDSHVKRIEAVSLYRGDFLQDFYLPDAETFEEWAAARRGAYRREVLNALSSLAEHGMQNHEYQDAERYARRQLEIDNLRESAHRQLMEALARSGQRTKALVHYEGLVELLRRELDVDPTPETQSLEEAIRKDELQTSPTPVSLDPQSLIPQLPPHNLPTQPTPFVGREKELEQLEELVYNPDIRLVTILGPGGIGKTRLALAAAQRLLEGPANSSLLSNELAERRFPDGINFASLVTANSVDEVLSHLAQALNFRFQPEGTTSRSQRQQLIHHLRQKRQLLILDNFEHLLAEDIADHESAHGANLLADILAAAPKISFLVTSRERLHLLEEQLMPIQGMAYPKPSVKRLESGVEEERYDAVQLFLERARRVRPDFSPSPDEFRQLIQICQLVEGMPLAIELAASWVGVVSPGDLAAEIQRDLEMLKSTIRNLPERHRSMRAAFDISWRLLRQEEREIFAQLSVFRGSFTLEAANQIALTSEGRGATLEMLTQLVDKSLVRYGEAPDRYDLHELLRQFAEERLAEIGGPPYSVRDRHSAYYCQAVRRWEIGRRTPLQFDMMKEFEADLANVQAAWMWAVKHDCVARLSQTFYHLYGLYMDTGRSEDGLRLFAPATERLEHLVATTEASQDGANLIDQERLLAGILIAQAVILFFRGQTETAEVLLQQSEMILCSPRLLDEDFRTDRAFLFEAKGFVARPDWSLSRNYMEESLALYQEMGEQWLMAFSLNHIAFAGAYLGEHDRARQAGEESLAIYRKLEDKRYSARGVESLAALARIANDNAEAKRRYEEALEIGQEIDSIGAIHQSLRGLGSLMRFCGKLEEAIDYFRQSTELADQHRERAPDIYRLIPSTLAELSITCGLAGDFPEALETIHEGLSLVEDLGDRVRQPTLMTIQGEIFAWIGQYDQARRQAEAALALGPQPWIWLLIPPYQPAHSYRVLGWGALAEGSYAEAQALLQKSVEGYREGIVDSENLAWTFAALARAEYGLGNEKAVKRSLLSALEITVKTRAFVPLLHLVPIIAVLLSEEEESVLKERAVEIYALAKSHPFVAKSKLIEDIAGRHVKAATASLPSDVVAAAKARGQRLDWWKTAEALLIELQENG